MPKVLNIKSNEARISDGVYIGRTTKWGNPFIIGRDGNRATVIAKYRNWIMRDQELLEQLGELKGKDLICHCAPQPCHGDILLRLANEE